MSDARLRGSDEVVFRRFADGDLERVSRMLLETPEAARYPEECSVAALSAQLDIPGHAPTRDRWVVVNRADPERLLAYCSVFKMPDTPRADMSIVTHPQARRQGIGAELLRRALADAAALGAQDAAGYINEQDTEALTFAARRGFAPVAAFTALRAAGGQTFSPPEWPAGATIRSWSGDADRETLLEAANSCYAGVWGHNVVTPEVLEHWLPTLDTRGVFFLFDASGTLIGMSRATPRETAEGLVGIVDAPGVVAQWRSADLYCPLLLHALAWLAPQRPAEYRIESWGDEPAVIAAYQAVGFAVTRREFIYSLRLSAHDAG